MTGYISETQAFMHALRAAGMPTDPATIEAVLAGVRADRAAMTAAHEDVASQYNAGLLTTRQMVGRVYALNVPPRPAAPATVVHLGKGYEARRAARAEMWPRAAAIIAALLVLALCIVTATNPDLLKG